MSEPNPTIELLKRLSQAVGITGYTQSNNIHDVITTEMTPYVDRLERDRVGSVIGLKHGQGEKHYKIMLAAHLDEIGAVVTKIEQGFLRFSRVGGLDDRVLMSQEITVHGQQRDLPGVIGSIPPHLLSGNNSRVDHQEMVIDVGLPAHEVGQWVRVGDLVSFARPAYELQGSMLSAKAMDNRSSIATMILCLQYLQKMHHSWDVYAVATADEEWGQYVGATTQGYAINPQVALAIDVTFADVSEVDIKLNGGPVIYLGPGNHPVVREQLIKVCNQLEMRYQTEVANRTAGTDAWPLEVTREGVPTVLLSIPSRYMHSPIEVVHSKDIERVARLMAHFIASLDDTFVETLVPKMELATPSAS